MARWFRFYDDVVNDRKVQRLSPHLFRTWVNLLCLASKSGGVLPNDDDLAYDLRMSVQDVRQHVEDLILAGLVDIDAKGARTPHNWENRQYASDSAAERMRKHRKAKKEKSGDVTRDVTVTPQSRTETETDTESNGLLSFPEAAREDPKVENKFLRKDGRQEKIVRRAEGLGLDTREIIEAVERHKAKNRPAYFTTICVGKLQERLPGLDEKIIRDALWGDESQYAAVMQLLVGVAA